MDHGLALMKLGGWALAQGLREVRSGRPLVTFAAWETAHGRDGARIDADGVAQSVATARENLAEVDGLLRWVIVAEGVATTASGSRLGALRAELGAHDSAFSGTAMWLFQPAALGFQIVQGPVLELPGVDPQTLGLLRLALLDAMHAPADDDGLTAS